MSESLRRIDLSEWTARYEELRAAGLREPWYGGPLGRHLADGDLRLQKLAFDDSPAALRLWNFLLTEEDRLHEARRDGRKIVGAMKDLGTIPVLAYSLPEVVAFYPDGAWWLPCIMELSAGLLAIADSQGLDESFCPVRAMVGAFVTEAHFPTPDLLTCSVGAVCDDFSAIAQRLNALGHPILWWELPRRRAPDPGEASIELPGGLVAPASQVEFVRGELERVRGALQNLCDADLTDEMLESGIERANRVRGLLREIRRLGFTAERCPMPALELLIVEALALHFCSDQEESLAVLTEILDEMRRRVDAGVGHFERDAVRVFWVNPVADLEVMNLLEDCGGRIAGTEYLFSHAIDEIPTDRPPMEALACAALSDPMIGPNQDRARRICADMRKFGSEALIISRIPGASHCALEGETIAAVVREELDLPVAEIEVSPVSDSFRSSLKTRIEAVVETARNRRRTRPVEAR